MDKLDHPVIETHCHLDMLKAPLDDVLEKGFESGIVKMITISTKPDNFSTVRELSKHHENVFCTQGVHPHYASLWTEETSMSIKKNLTMEKVVAIGEIGLDYHYNHSPREIQIKVFEEQLAIALGFDLPVVIHTRNADEDTMAILKNFSSSSLKGVLHSYTSGRELATAALKMDLYLGFNGIITFKKAQNVREVLHETPVSRILLETDAPFLTPEPHRGKENAPYYLPFIAKKVGEIKNKPLEELLPPIFENSKQLFNL